MEFIHPIIKEFFKALGKGYTYNIRANYYTIFGILWGIPVPVVTIGIGLYFSGLPFTLQDIVSHVTAYPMYLFFLIHPFMFGIVFGAMGTVRGEKESERLEFENRLIAINEELKNANKKLRELDELKDNFLSMVSHELLTPLTTIQGYITFLKEGKSGALTAKQLEALKITDEEADHLKLLIEDLMDLSRIRCDKFAVKLGPTDIGAVINKVKNTFEPSFKANRLTLEDRLPSGLPFVLADPNRITQVLSNLLRNAIKFTSSGGKITICGDVSRDRVVFCIEDTGIGIPREKLTQVFEKFYQIDSSATRRYGGCGLGLPIAKHIIELHRGRIWADSEEGKGSKFCFELERAKTGGGV